ncbi:MAG: hypothetical protein AAFN93_03780 [Bacteroidota bacterium]
MSMTSGMVAIGISSYVLINDPATVKQTPQLSDNMSKLALIAANLYIIFFNASWRLVTWMIQLATIIAKINSNLNFNTYLEPNLFEYHFSHRSIR